MYIILVLGNCSRLEVWRIKQWWINKNSLYVYFIVCSITAWCYKGQNACTSGWDVMYIRTYVCTDHAMDQVHRGSVVLQLG